MEPGLEAFGQAAKVEVRGAEERMAGLHAVEVGEEHVLGVLGAAVEFVHEAGLADTGSAGDQELEWLVGSGSQSLGFPHQHICHLAGMSHEVIGTEWDEAGGRDGRLLTRHSQSLSL